MSGPSKLHNFRPEMQHECGELFATSLHRNNLSDQLSSGDLQLLDLTDVVLQELYVRRRDLYNKLFPPEERIKKKFVRKLSDLKLRRLTRGRSAILRRSLSVGSPRIYWSRRGGGGGDDGEEEPLILHRFKVRIVDLDEDRDFPHNPPQGGQINTTN